MKILIFQERKFQNPSESELYPFYDYYCAYLNNVDLTKQDISIRRRLIVLRG